MRFRGFPWLCFVYAMSHYARNYAFLAQLSQWGAISTSLTTIFLALSIVVLSTVFRSQSDDKIHKLHGLYIVNAWSFCSKRYNFLRENFKKTGVKMFRFSLLQVSFLTGIQYHEPSTNSAVASRDCDGW